MRAYFCFGGSKMYRVDIYANQEKTWHNYGFSVAVVDVDEPESLGELLEDEGYATTLDEALAKIKVLINNDLTTR